MIEVSHYLSLEKGAAVVVYADPSHPWLKLGNNLTIFPTHEQLVEIHKAIGDYIERVNEEKTT